MWLRRSFLSFLRGGWGWIHLKCLNLLVGTQIIILIISYDTEQIWQRHSGADSKSIMIENQFVPLMAESVIYQEFLNESVK